VHVVNLYGRALGDMRRSSTPHETAELNALCIAEYDERDPAAVADRIATDAARVWDEVLPGLPDDLAIPFHAGARSTIVPIMGVLLAEMLVHGDDIARAAAMPWNITDDDAWSALQALVVLLPAWRRPEVQAADTITLLGTNDDVVRITCEGHDTVVAWGPVQPTDRAAPERPADVLFGLFGRRPAAGPLADRAVRALLSRCAIRFTDGPTVLPRSAALPVRCRGSVPAVRLTCGFARKCSLNWGDA
jgi:hypothetical protein